MKEVKVLSNNCKRNIEKETKTIAVYSIVRFFSFFSFFMLILIGFRKENNFYFFFSIFSFLIFIYYVFKTEEKKRFLKFNAEIIAICETLIHEKVENKNDYLERDHEFASDLEILGVNSLIQRLNYAQSEIGKNKIKLLLTNLEFDINKIIERQKISKEFSKKINWSINFLATIRISNIEINKKKVNVRKFKLIDTKLIYPVIIINLVCLIYFLFTPISIYSLIAAILPFFFFILIEVLNSKKRKSNYIYYTNRVFNIGNLVKILNEIENYETDINYIFNLKKKLFNSDKKASKVIEKLAYYCTQYERGNVPVVGGIMNVFLLWRYVFISKIKDESEIIDQELNEWLDVISDFEAFISFGLYAFKNKDFVYPNVNDNYFFSFKKVSHPFIKKERRVNNDFTIPSIKNINIITGANMTGKSTFLKTIGVNFVLAMNGLPVCAEKFDFTPVNIFTSIRTNDSLEEGYSYFNAEILRLKKLIKQMDTKIPYLIILDEILKGTNSKDKLVGSKMFLKKLLKYEKYFTCIIATHDLDLTDIELDYPQFVKNYCFELIEKEDDLVSTYLISEGVTQSMNAIRLMKMNNIID